MTTMIPRRPAVERIASLLGKIIHVENREVDFTPVDELLGGYIFARHSERTRRAGFELAVAYGYLSLWRADDGTVMASEGPITPRQIASVRMRPVPPIIVDAIRKQDERPAKPGERRVL